MFVVAEARYGIVLAPLIIGVALFFLVLVCTKDRRTRIAFACAISASVALAFGSILMSLCRIVEGSTPLYESRCASGSYLWPLLGIPALLALAFFTRRLHSTALWLAGTAILLAALAGPFFWLTTAR